MAQRPGLRCGRNVISPTVLQRIAVLRNLPFWLKGRGRRDGSRAPWAPRVAPGFCGIEVDLHHT